MDKRLLVSLSLALVLAGCAANGNGSGQAAASDDVVNPSGHLVKGPVVVAEISPYVDASVIDQRIVAECVELGANLSKATQAFGERYGVEVVRQKEVDTQAPGTTLVVKIASATSGGNAFLGHHKTVSVKAELYQDGKMVSSTLKTRNSSGGFGGGFMGSCDVLDRTVNTLGSDVIKWVQTL